ncbi:MAG: potassium transporter Kup [Betaproteobacteria bacterium]|nr:potassium transporter Kup [Betaproteobacteria bacterium]
MDAQDSSHKQSQAALTLVALGVVFGDIGTSPLYAVKEVFSPAHGIPMGRETVLGGISAIFWSLMVVVTLKYVLLIMRASNKGEGGIMALLALATASVRSAPHWRYPLVVIGLLGAALFYGDAVITPAISVLSAVEGLEVGTAAFKPYVLPIAIGVIVGLFLMQRHGTAAVGLLFGPVTALWFLALGAVGLWGLAKTPEILMALNPAHALTYVSAHGFSSFVVLGAVVLAVTGGEALYADMGHFGKRPIRLAWFGLVLPALMLNYLGQGALLLRTPEAVSNPFYLQYPSWALYPMIGLATAATVIASQATISGAYSLTKQAMQLGYLPRMNVVQTSAKEIGQVYLPAVNWILLVVVLGAVLGFGSSSALASAYGLAVTGTMLVTTFLTFFVIRYSWGYPLWLCVAATGFFIVVDIAFFSASLLKFAEGGWFPVLLAGVVFTVMLTWRRGREILRRRLQDSAIPLEPFLKSLFEYPPLRVPGTAVFMIANAEAVPHALLHNLSHNKVLHERVVFLTVQIEDVPWVPFGERVAVESLGRDCWRMTVRFGFKNKPDVTQALELARAHGLEFEMLETSFFLSRETLIPVRDAADGMALWRERMFAALARNASSVTDYFNIPTNRVIELGTKIEI